MMLLTDTHDNVLIPLATSLKSGEIKQSAMNPVSHRYSCQGWVELLPYVRTSRGWLGVPCSTTFDGRRHNHAEIS